MPFQGDFNAAFAIVRDGFLPKQSDDDLDRILETLRRLQASFNFHETAPCIEAVEKEKDRRQKERHHSESKSELNRLHQEQMAEVKRMFTKSDTDSDKKHAETSKTATTANFIAGTALVASIVAVIVGHHDSKQPLIAGANATELKSPPAQPEKHQIVLPPPTNLIETNAAPKK